jgi:cytochrome c556
LNKKTVPLAGFVILLCFLAVSVMAIDVVKPGKATATQVVAARKFAMVTNVTNLGDLNAKLTASSIRAMVANARSLATIGAFLPLAFAQAYTEVYPVAGSKFFFKQGSMDDFQAKAQAFVNAAEDLSSLADKDDKDGVTAQLKVLPGTCGASHAVFRGQGYGR